MKSLLIAVMSLAFLSVGAQAKTATSKKPAETKPTEAAHCTKAEEHAGHKHGADCGCKKVDAHGHTHYEHNGHHHVEHDGHYDECDKPHGA